MIPPGNHSVSFLNSSHHTHLSSLSGAPIMYTDSTGRATIPFHPLKKAVYTGGAPVRNTPGIYHDSFYGNHVEVDLTGYIVSKVKGIPHY